MKNYIDDVIKIWEKESYNNEILKKKMNHSRRVANYITLLTHNENDAFFGWIHDIGRIEQYHKIKSFDDSKYNHTLAGIDYVYKKNIEYIKNNDEAKNIIIYHSNYNKAPKEKQTKLLYYVTISDQLDNALTCKDYLLEEERNNAKSFSSENVFSHYFKEAIYTENVNLDKIHCQTYLDYFYFAFSLLLRLLDNNDILNILSDIDRVEIDLTFNFFEELFSNRLNGDIKDKILTSLVKYKRLIQ